MRDILADAYMRGDSDSFFRHMNLFSNHQIGKRDFLSQEYKGMLNEKYSNCKYFRGMNEYLDFLKVLRNLKKTRYGYKPEEIYLIGSILSHGVEHNDVDLAVLTNDLEDKIQVCNFVQRKSLTSFQFVFMPLDINEIKDEGNFSLVQRMFKNSRKIRYF
jgi:hypothetical protein